MGLAAEESIARAAWSAAGGTLERVGDIASRVIEPLATRIDRDGLYPAEALRELGAAGAYRQHLASQSRDRRTDLMGAIESMAVVSSRCLSTGFMTWCQDALGWYLECSDNPWLRENVLPQVASGSLLGGTGLSNPMKHYAGIEALRLSARETSEGFVVTGTLPWVSNLGPGHGFGTVFQADAGGAKRDVMAFIDCTAPGVTLRACPPFMAMDGTGTYAVQFDGVLVPHRHVIADPVGPYLARIRGGFILLQAGMAAGLVTSCIELMREVEPVLGHVNGHCEDGPAQLEDELAAATAELAALCREPLEPGEAYFRDVLELRLVAGELSLRAAQSAMLHQGARGYLMSSPAQRKVRESYFVAIVTPALKHLRKDLDRMARAH
jgi:alkylation response protein AidB-like acyl-CoA dehydrogenase